MSIGKLNTTITKSILCFSLSLTEISLGLCRINLGRNQITLFLQILLHFLRNILISDQLINLRHSFRIKTMLNLNISLIVSTLELFINFINGKLDLLALFLDKIPIEFKALRIFGNIRVFRIATKFLGFGVQLINSSIGNCLLVLHTLTLGNSSNKIKITRTHRGLRIRSRRISSNTSTTGRITENSLRSYTSGTPFSNLTRRLVHLLKLINTPFPIIMLQSHIFLITRLSNCIMTFFHCKGSSSGT